jgi:hypothetical protein
MKKLLILNLFLPFLMADMELDSNNAFISFNQLQMPADKVPIAVKDNIDVKDMITSAGSLALENNLITEDAFLVTKLKQNNYFIIGKLQINWICFWMVKFGGTNVKFIWKEFKSMWLKFRICGSC